MLHEVVRRQFVPTFGMLREVVESYPDELIADRTIGMREHAYHALIGVDVWLHPKPIEYPSDEIAEPEAGQLQAPASTVISREFLLRYLERMEKKATNLCAECTDFFEEQTMQGKTSTVLDRFLGQLRHVQHHVGVVNAMISAQGAKAGEWRGFGE